MRRLSLIQRHPAIVCVLLGAAAACGFAPLDLWPLTIACFAVWMWLIHDAATLKQAMWRGWIFCVGHFTINDNWFQHAFDFQDKMPPALGYAAPLALALYLAAFPAVGVGIAWRLRGRTLDLAWVLIFAACWITTEWLRGTLFTGYAWDPLGVAWLPLIGVARLSALVGTYAMSGVMIVAAGTLLLAVRGARALPIGVFGALALVALVLAPDRAPPPGLERVRVVQPNVPQDQRGDNDADFLLARLSRLSGRPGVAPRLVVWPEGVIRPLLEDGYPLWVYRGTDPARVRRELGALLGPNDMLMAGGNALQFDARDDVVSASNSVFAIAPDGRLTGRYDKAHLVPYGEYLPMPWLLGPLGLARLVPGDSDFLDGPGPRTLDLPGFGPIGVQICYEIIFSGEVIDPARRPRLLFNPSNDAWFGTWGPPQHLAQARMRAIEEGLPIVRSTPNGISAVIAADGHLIATIPHQTSGAIEVAMPMPMAPTPFARSGNWAATIVVLLLAATAIAIRWRGR